MGKYNILLLGSGGREHALAWKISQSPGCKHLFIAPGNGGTASAGYNVDLDPGNFDAVGVFCLDNDIEFLVIGPEAPLVDGIVDHFRAHKSLEHICCIGPDSRGAILEGSKAFAKVFMRKHGIPTAAYRGFKDESATEGREYIASHPLPVVLKADGLAAGKGVLICQDHKTALAEFDAMLEGKFGAASEKVVVEEFLDGIEFSVFVLTDGASYKILPVAKDYKRIGLGDTGLNTGGMGSVSPVSFVDEELMLKVENKIIRPTVDGLRKDGVDYRGFIFFGLIKVGNEPYVIEYNCRLGDPETQVVLPRLSNDLVDLFEAVRDRTLASRSIDIDSNHAVATVCVSEGYPGKYPKGKVIKLPETRDGEMIFHAGTKVSDKQLLSSGGRVLACVAFGKTMSEAISRSQKLAKAVDYDGKYFRSDIGFDL